MISSWPAPSPPSLNNSIEYLPSITLILLRVPQLSPNEGSWFVHIYVKLRLLRGEVTKTPTLPLRSALNGECVVGSQLKRVVSRGRIAMQSPLQMARPA